MTSIAAHHEEHSARPGPPPPPRRLAPSAVSGACCAPRGWCRSSSGSAARSWCSAAGGAVGTRFWFGEIIVLVGALIAAPIGFLAGIGAFDYWVRYAIGAPTEPEDHSGHGAYSWRDYFRVNTDHKVIGMQYLATTIFFFLAGGLLAMLVRAELAKPGMQFFDNQTYNGLFSGACVADDLPVRDSGVRRARELRRAAHARRARHGVPTPQRVVVLAAADRRDHDAVELPRPRWRIRGRLDRLRPVVRPSAHGHDLLQHGRPVGGRELDHDRAQLPGHDHHHARARNDLLAHAPARMGELHHVAARRDRNAVHRRLAVLRHVRPRHAHALLRRRQVAATRSATSTSSGSTRTRRSTS